MDDGVTPLPARQTLELQGNVRRIAVFRALFLGDLLCSVPALRALRQRFPDAKIALIGLPWAAALVERLPYLDRLIEFPGYPGLSEQAYVEERTTAFLAEMRQEAFDLAIQMHGSGVVSNGLVAELAAGITLGYRHGPDRRLIHALPYHADEHEVLRWLRLVGELGATDEPRLEFCPTLADEQRAASLLGQSRGTSGPTVVLHCGAKDAARRWPAERFAALADELINHFDARVVLSGSASEAPLTLEVQSHMRGPALDLAGATDVGAFAAVLAPADLLVTNDTGASHLAAALGTRSVVLFGPTRPANWAPLDRHRHRIVDAMQHVVTGDGARSLRELPVGPVLFECNALLRGKALAVGS